MRTADRWRGVLRLRWIGYLVALVAVALVSGLIGLILAYITIPNVSMLYLIAVLAAAVAFGSGPAILASFTAFLTFDWFFVMPLHTFTIDRPEEWLALLLFLLTALITGQLAAGQRDRAHQAEQREREAVVLYDVVRLVGDPDLKHALGALAERLRQELQLVAVAIELTDNRESPVREVVGDVAAIRTLSNVPTEMLSEGAAPSRERRASPGRWVRVIPPYLPGLSPQAGQEDVHVVPVKSQGRRAGTILLAHPPGAPEFDPADDRLLSAVASQLGLAVERRRLRQEATEAEILRRTDELRTALLNAVSHDLRTPLASIMASGGSLLQKDVEWTEQEKDEFAGAIVREAQRLNRIVGNLLDLSRIEAGSLRPELDWYPIGALMDDVLGRLRPTTARHRLVLDVQRELPPVPLDYVEIDQVLSNLVENAVKYSPAGSEIRISARREGEEVRIEVADQGSGIPAEAMARLFEPFYRVEDGAPRPKGTGLGLAVARGLVEAHGGRIWAERQQGGGTIFVFTLPLSRQDKKVVTQEQRA